MVNKNISLVSLLLNFAVGAMLAVGGIWALQGGGDFGCKALVKIFNGDSIKLVRAVFGVIELVCGIFIILQLFIGSVSATVGTVLKLVVLVVWAVAIILADFAGGFLRPNFLEWIYQLSMHLIVLCALLVTKE